MTKFYYQNHFNLRGDKKTFRNYCNYLPVLFSVLIILFFSGNAIAQTASSPADCKSGCTSNDVQITKAFLSDINGNPLTNYICGNGVPVYLSLNLKTNTPRVGVSIYTDVFIYDPITKSTGAPISGSPVKQCFGKALSTSTNIVTFSSPLNWDCSVGPIVLANTYTAWGTGNTNFCTGSGFQCNGTPSKCHLALPGELIVVQLPTPNNISDTKCSETDASYLGHFDLTSYESTIKSDQTNTVKWYRTWSSANGFSNQIIGPDLTSFAVSSAQVIVYAQVCDATTTTACSKAELTLNVKTKPGKPSVSVLNNCDGTSTLTVTGLANGATVNWTDDATNHQNPRSVTTASSFVCTQTLNGCTSVSSDAVSASPKTTPGKPSISVQNNCDGTSTLTVTGLSNGATVNWADDATKHDNPRSVGAGTYSATQSLNGCTSVSSDPVTAAPKTTPGKPTVTVQNNCNGTSTLTVTGVVNGATVNWADDATNHDNPRNVTVAANYTATQTLNSCTSVSSDAVAATPKTTPGKPSVSVQDNCNGTSTLTVTGLVNGATLNWTDDPSKHDNPRIVNTSGSYTAFQTLNGCTSANSDAVTTAPKTTPGKPSVSVQDNCNGTSTLTVTGLVNGATLNWADDATNHQNPRIVSTAASFTATQTLNGCTSASSDAVTTAPKTTPAAPYLVIVDNCNNTSTITAYQSNAQGSPLVTGSELNWTGTSQTGNPITVSTTTQITATRTVSGCQSSNSNPVTPSPKSTPGKPLFTVTQPSLCGPSTGTLTICQSVTGYDYTIGNTTKHGDGNAMSFTGLTAGSNPSLTVTLINSNGANCPSAPYTCSDAAGSCVQGPVTQQADILTKEVTLYAESKTRVVAAPNPFNDHIRFSIKSNISGQGVLELYNMLGQKVKTVFQGYVNADQLQTIEYGVPGAQRANLIYIFRVGSEKVSGKLIGLK